MKIFIDTDLTLQKFRDPDDALALSWLIKYVDSKNISGISTVFGNGDVKKSKETLEKMISEKNGILSYLSEIPIYLGARKRLKRKKQITNTDAAMALGNFIFEKGRYSDEEEPRVVLCLGPLTNLATALLLRQGEELPQKQLYVVCCGGCTSKKHKLIKYFGEFNFKKDPVATNEVINRINNLTIVPVDSAHRARIPYKSLKIWRDRFFPKVLKHAKSWSSVFAVFFGYYGIYPWDVVTTMILTNQNLFRFDERFLSVREKGIRRGSLIVKSFAESSAAVSPTRLAFLNFIIIFSPYDPWSISVASV